MNKNWYEKKNHKCEHEVYKLVRDFSPHFLFVYRREREKARYRLHIVRHVYGVKLVGKETVAQVHALLFAAWVNGHDAGINDNNDAHDEMMLLEDGAGHEGDEIQGLALTAVELHHDYQKIRPCEHSAVTK